MQEIPLREASLYYCVDRFLERTVHYIPDKLRIGDLAYQIYATHNGKLDLFRHNIRPVMEPPFKLTEAVHLVHTYLKNGSCKPHLGTQREQKSNDNS